MSTKKKNCHCKKSKNVVDFSNIGGLSHHLKVLRDIVIVPLIHNNVYTYFNVKAPKGILFYGPPGTGKTLVAGALATEMNKEGVGKVSFYQRKGADILDKWVGESEKKLRALFEIAAKTRPSVIFFDELDGLAPVRSNKNDHVHCSIVTTLLALMDGLDSSQGVIIIGATNRLDAVDPALRRPGRFDRELYFPLPSTQARKEILEVHTRKWKNKPSGEFIAYLAEITSGFCGSDLQALCSEAILCGLKRLYPQINNINNCPKLTIQAEHVVLQEEDFITACKNLVPSCQKLGSHRRKLDSTITPLLQNQLDMILARVRILWPHYSEQFFKYLIGNDRYIGRLLLYGDNMQGLNTHLVPAILRHYEHLPLIYIEAKTLNDVTNIGQTLPSLVVLPRIDELWHYIDENDQSMIASTLSNIHSGLPILIIATVQKELPCEAFFHDNTSIVVKIRKPVLKEIESFLSPLFFGDQNSVLKVLEKKRIDDTNMKVKKKYCQSSHKCSRKFETNHHHQNTLKVYDINNAGKITKSRTPNPPINLNQIASRISNNYQETEKKSFSTILSDLLIRSVNIFKFQVNKPTYQGGILPVQLMANSTDPEKLKIHDLWRKACNTGLGMSVALLEVFYDSIAACISIYRHDFQALVNSLEVTLNDVECISTGKEIMH